jgi:hypothetical protein
MEQVRITDAELRDLEASLRTLVEDSELMAGLLILERGEIENTCTVVRSLIGKSATVRTSRSKSGARTALEAEGVEDEDS